MWGKWRPERLGNLLEVTKQVTELQQDPGLSDVPPPLLLVSSCPAEVH